MDSLINTARRARAAHRLLAVLALGLALGASPAGAYAEMRDTDAICGRTYTEETRETEDRPDIACQEAIVMGKDGTVYFERDADKEVKIASITKVMTAIVVLENTSADDELVVGHRAATVGQSSADLREGDVLTRDEALKALMIPSGNDAAMALATFTGSKIDPASSDPYQVFIDAMNAKAQELGMDHSVFANPHGLDFDGWEGDFHSTARDVATMFAHAMEDETFRELTANPDNQITVTSADGTERTIDMVERNKILGTESNIGSSATPAARSTPSPSGRTETSSAGTTRSRLRTGTTATWSPTPSRPRRAPAATACRWSPRRPMPTGRIKRSISPSSTPTRRSTSSAWQAMSNSSSIWPSCTAT